MSHNCLIDNREEWARPGTMWPTVASKGRPGSERFPMWVECITSPSGKVIFNGFVAGRLLTSSTFGNRKWAVAPESAMARLGPSSRLIWGSVGSLKLESSSLRDAVVAVASSDLAVQLLAMIVISSSSTKGL